MNSTGNKEKPDQNNFTKYRNPLLHRILFRGEHYYVNGPQSRAFNRKKYELPIQSLTSVTNQNLGFTNRILQKKAGRKVNLFLPVYLALKIKRINEIDLKELTAKVNCVLVIYIYIQHLPEIVVNSLKEKLFIQLNKQGFVLNQKTPNVRMKMHTQYVQFTIREILQTDLQGDIFLTPFEILDLILSVTLNSLEVHLDPSFSGTNRESKEDEIDYIVRFNCMRCPEKVTITYLEDCRFGVYDLAEKLLETYPSNLASYDQIKDQFADWINEQEGEQSFRLEMSLDVEQATLHKQNISVPASRAKKPLKIKGQTKSKKPQKKQNDFKSYFQYNHFIIPIYKMPGNALATIFIPMFMLAILSISIFLQNGGSISEEISVIATFVLSFIALIPSIKDQIPPSQKLTLSEIIAYIEALNCMLSLLNRFNPKNSKKASIFKNPLFVISLTIHFACFLLLICILLLHKLSWENLYSEKKTSQSRFHHQKRFTWNNPYCDDVFLRYNQEQADSKLQFVPYP